jgi:hypothetical protein
MIMRIKLIRNIILLINILLFFNIISKYETLFKNNLVLDNIAYNKEYFFEKKHTKIYLILNFDYNYFLDINIVEFFLELKTKELNENHIIEDFKFISSLLFDFFKKIKNKDGLSYLAFILDGIGFENNFKNLNILKKNLEILINRSNNKLCKIKDLDLNLKIIFWTIFFIYNFREIYLNEDKNNLKFIITYPYHESIEEITYKNISMNKIIEKSICPELLTEYGKNNAVMREISPRFINEDMAYDIIKRRKIFIDILTNNKNETILCDIKNQFNKIVNLLYLLSEKTNNNKHAIDFNKINYFLNKNIPPDIFGGKDATSAACFLSNFKSYGETCLWALLDFFKNKFEEEISSPINLNNVNIKQEIIENKGFIKYFFPYIVLSPRVTIKSQYFNNENFFTTIWKLKTIGDFYLFSKKNFLDIIRSHNYYKNFIFSLKLIDFSYDIFYLFINWQDQKHTIGAIIEIDKYFSILKNLIKETKKLIKKICFLYKKNEINDNLFLPEIQAAMNIFIKNKSQDRVIKEILKWRDSSIETIKMILQTFFFPSFISKFYFNDFEKSKSLKFLYSFIGTIDLAFAKIKLLKNNLNSRKLFCKPIIIPKKYCNNEAILILKNTWYPNLSANSHIFNSISLVGENKNVIIVSPTAGGKSVILSTIIANLYFANMGITPAESMIYSYFFNIVDNLVPIYEIGSGISSSVAERKAMRQVKDLIEDPDENKNRSIIFVDEIYKGTRPDIAIEKIKDDIKVISGVKNIIFIMTTHLSEVTKLVNNPSLGFKLYYLQVDEKNGVFENKYILKLDDENNWWIKDIEKAIRYHEWQDKEFFEK